LKRLNNKGQQHSQTQQQNALLCRKNERLNGEMSTAEVITI
jgi:hypothetical protein